MAKHALTHKEQYRLEYMTAIADYLSITITKILKDKSIPVPREILAAIYKLRNFDTEFESWYKTNFPDE